MQNQPQKDLVKHTCLVQEVFNLFCPANGLWAMLKVQKSISNISKVEDNGICTSVLLGNY